MDRYVRTYRYFNGDLSDDKNLNGRTPIGIVDTKYDGETDSLLSKSYYSCDNDGNPTDFISEVGFRDGNPELRSYEQEDRIVKTFVYDDADNLILTEKYDVDGAYLGGRQRYCNGELTDELHASVVFNGKKYSFNATELRKIEKTLGDFANDLGAALKTVANRCSIIAGVVSSNDTHGYSATLNNAGKSILAWEKDVNGFVDDLAGDIEKYVHDTIVNEAGQKENLDAINHSLENLNVMFDSINDYS